MRGAALGLMVSMAVWSAGCGGGGDQLRSLSEELLERDNRIRSLQRDLARAQRVRAGQESQIRRLQALGPRRLERLFHVRRIRLGRFTGGFDQDGRPGHEGVKVFLQPIDAYGSVIKAAGDVTVELFDLTGGADGERIAEYVFGVDAIGKHWYSGALTYHYRFNCPWPQGRTPPNEVTVRVSFVDYLTGDTHTAQKRCVVDPPEPEATTDVGETARRPPGPRPSAAGGAI